MYGGVIGECCCGTNTCGVFIFFCLFLNDFIFISIANNFVFFLFSLQIKRNKRIIMKMKQSNLVIFAVAFFVIFTAETFACSCMPSHPQTSYCNSDFGEFIILKIKLIYRFYNCVFFISSSTVIVARILRRSNRRTNNQHIYKIDIVKQYKVSFSHLEGAVNFMKRT